MRTPALVQGPFCRASGHPPRTSFQVTLFFGPPPLPESLGLIRPVPLLPGSSPSRSLGNWGLRGTAQSGPTYSRTTLRPSWPGARPSGARISFFSSIGTFSTFLFPLGSRPLRPVGSLWRGGGSWGHGAGAGGLSGEGRGQE